MEMMPTTRPVSMVPRVVIPSAIVVMMATVGTMYVLMVYIEMGDFRDLSGCAMRRMHISSLRGG